LVDAAAEQLGAVVTNQRFMAAAAVQEDVRAVERTSVGWTIL
jgi:hypothetical protein